MSDALPEGLKAEVAATALEFAKVGWRVVHWRLQQQLALVEEAQLKLKSGDIGDASVLFIRAGKLQRENSPVFEKAIAL